MTLTDSGTDDVRRRFPEWFVWRVGDRWWAKHRRSTDTLNADDLDALSLRLERQMAAAR